MRLKKKAKDKTYANPGKGNYFKITNELLDTAIWKSFRNKDCSRIIVIRKNKIVDSI